MSISEILDRILERIRNNRQDYVSNEANVRAHLINPVLRSLGWDPDDPDFVKHNQRTKETEMTITVGKITTVQKRIIYPDIVIS